MNKDSVNIKAFYKSEIRRTRMIIDSFHSLKKKLKELFYFNKHKEITISYLDDENDYVTMSTDFELEIG